MNRILFIIFITTIVVVGCLLSVACGDDDDDDSGDDDSGDDDDDDSVYRTCGDLPEAYGTGMPMETLDCGGRLPLHRSGDEWEPIEGYDVNLGGAMIRDQETLDLFQEAADITPRCTIDFSQYVVLAAWYFSDPNHHADTDLSICGIYDGSEGLTVPVLINIGSGADMYSSAMYYHFVRIERTEALAEFLTCFYAPEANSNWPSCGW